jgi:hypothetical protein
MTSLLVNIFQILLITRRVILDCGGTGRRFGFPVGRKAALCQSGHSFKNDKLKVMDGFDSADQNQN